MNCVDFETIVVDLARNLPLDATMKQEGLQHGQSCVRCAGRLKTEQTLSRGLRAVAKGDQWLNAPPALESALLAAFRQQAEAAPVAANVIVPTFAKSPLKRFFAQFRWAFVPAAALTAIALIAFAVSRVLQPATPQQPVIVKSATPAPTVSATPSLPEQIEPPAPEPEPELRASVSRPATQVKAHPNRLSARPQTGRVTVTMSDFEVDEPETVSAKDFLVFDYAQNLPPADNVQLMRVRLPRERLVPLGIPLPRETRHENFVNADFLVGSDGVPRAIRVANR